jgi:hypothetical protein
MDNIHTELIIPNRRHLGKVRIKEGREGMNDAKKKDKDDNTYLWSVEMAPAAAIPTLAKPLSATQREE